MLKPILLLVGFVTGLMAVTFFYRVAEASDLVTDDNNGGEHRTGLTDALRRVVLVIAGKPVIIDEKMIDEMVGEPGTLKAETEARLSTLPSKERMRLYTFMAQNFSALAASDGSMNSSEGPLVLGGLPVALTLPEKESEALIRNLADGFRGHFSTAEIIDLGVYLLSKFSFFPKEPAEWNRLKQRIVRYDIWLGLAMALAYATRDELDLRMSGWLVKVPGTDFRVGWYGSAEQLGFEMHPKLRYGMNLRTKEFGVSVGGVERPNAEADSGPDHEKRAFELQIRNRWLERFGNLTGWELDSTAAVRYIGSHEDRSQNGDFEGLMNAYARKGRFLGRRANSLMVSAKADGNFRNRFTLETSGTFENEDAGLQISLMAKASQTPDQSKPEYFAGVFAGGGFQSDCGTLRRGLYSTGAMIRDEVELLEKYSVLIVTQAKVFEGLLSQPSETAFTEWADSTKVIVESLDNLKESVQGRWVSYREIQSRFSDKCVESAAVGKVGFGPLDLEDFAKLERWGVEVD